MMTVGNFGLVPLLASAFIALSGTVAATAAINASSALSANNQVVAFATIRPILNTALCVTATGNQLDSQQVLAPCTGGPEQSWAVNQVGDSRSTVFQFQNRATILCFSIHVDPFNGELVQNNGCTNSDGSGDPVSNTLWDTNPQTLGNLNNGPVVVTALKNRIHFSTTNFCLDSAGSSGSNLVVRSCTGVIGQTWLFNPGA